MKPYLVIADRPRDLGVCKYSIERRTEKHFFPGITFILHVLFLVDRGTLHVSAQNSPGGNIVCSFKNRVPLVSVKTVVALLSHILFRYISIELVKRQVKPVNVSIHFIPECSEFDV